MSLKACRECGKEVSTDAKLCPHCGVGKPTRSTRKRGKIAAAMIVTGIVLVALIAIAGNDNNKSTDTNLPAADQAAAAPAPGLAVPPDEAAFIAAVQGAANAYRSGSNDMDKGASRPARATAICTAVQAADVMDWVGTIDDLSSNNDGKGILKIKLAPHLTVGTTNNDFSDSIGMRTLIAPSSPVFAMARTMAQGQPVLFSGSFEPSKTDCFNEMSLSIEGSMLDPDFLMAFSSLRKP